MWADVEVAKNNNEKTSGRRRRGATYPSEPTAGQTESVYLHVRSRTHHTIHTLSRSSKQAINIISPHGLVWRLLRLFVVLISTLGVSLLESQELPSFQGVLDIFGDGRDNDVNQKAHDQQHVLQAKN